MRNWFKSRQRKILGVDISSSSVKMIEMSCCDDQYSVEGFGNIVLPESAVEGTVIKEIETVANSIRNLISTERLSSKKAAIAVPDSLAISRVIQINEGLNEEEIEELVTIEADKYIPYPIDEINLDFNILGPSAKNLAMLDILIVASRAENVSDRVEVITRAGLEPVVVDVESYAIERAAQFLAHDLPAKGENKIVAIIDIGNIFTRFFILHGLKIIFAREEEFGGKQLINLIAQRYSMSSDEAAKAMLAGELPEDYESDILPSFEELILLQVKRGLQFFFSSSHYTYIDYILLAGGVAKLPDLAQLLQEHINIPTSLANPFKRMDIARKVNQEKVYEYSPSLLIACGLALRSSNL